MYRVVKFYWLMYKFRNMVTCWLIEIYATLNFRRKWIGNAYRDFFLNFSAVGYHWHWAYHSCSSWWILCLSHSELISFAVYLVKPEGASIVHSIRVADTILLLTSSIPHLKCTRLIGRHWSMTISGAWTWLHLWGQNIPAPRRGYWVIFLINQGPRDSE